MLPEVSLMYLVLPSSSTPKALTLPEPQRILAVLPNVGIELPNTAWCLG
jgi:hypothetical protein